MSKQQTGKNRKGLQVTTFGFGGGILLPGLTPPDSGDGLPTIGSGSPVVDAVNAILAQTPGSPASQALNELSLVNSILDAGTSFGESGPFAASTDYSDGVSSDSYRTDATTDVTGANGSFKLSDVTLTVGTPSSGSQLLDLQLDPGLLVRAASGERTLSGAILDNGLAGEIVFNGGAYRLQLSLPDAAPLATQSTFSYSADGTRTSTYESWGPGDYQSFSIQDDPTNPVSWKGGGARETLYWDSMADSMGARTIRPLVPK